MYSCVYKDKKEGRISAYKHIHTLTHRSQRSAAILAPQIHKTFKDYVKELRACPSFESQFLKLKVKKKVFIKRMM